MPSKPTKPESPAHSSRKLYKPMPVQNRVTARHIAGESDRQIALKEGIDRATVSRILNQAELVAMLAHQQSCLVKMGYKAIGVLDQALHGDDTKTAVTTATKLLEGTGVLNKQGLQGTIDAARKRHEARAAEPGRLFPGEFDLFD